MNMDEIGPTGLPSPPAQIVLVRHLDVEGADGPAVHGAELPEVRLAAPRNPGARPGQCDVLNGPERCGGCGSAGMYICTDFKHGRKYIIPHTSSMIENFDQNKRIKCVCVLGLRLL